MLYNMVYCKVYQLSWVPGPKPLTNPTKIHINFRIANPAAFATADHNPFRIQHIPSDEKSQTPCFLVSSPSYSSVNIEGVGNEGY